jgi:hypothetical protein
LATNRSVVRVVAVVCLSLLAVTVPGTARASHGDNSTSIRDRDNNTQDWDMHSLSGAGEDACIWGAGELEVDSEITMKAFESGDIHCYDDYYVTEPWFGMTRCTDVNLLNRRCDHYRIYINLSIYGSRDNDFEHRAYHSVGCHEFGHTSSVGHRGVTGTCMQSGSINQHFDSHDTSAINADA